MARQFDIAWARQAVVQCREAGVAVFVKQLGAHTVSDDPADLVNLSGKADDPEEWPEDLRVREFPRERT